MKEDTHYWDSVCEIQRKQTEKGLRTYGQRLEDNKSLTLTETLTYKESK